MKIFTKWENEIRQEVKKDWSLASFDPKLLTYPFKFTFTGHTFYSFPRKGVIYHDESALVALTLWATFRIFFQTVDRVLQ